MEGESQYVSMSEAAELLGLDRRQVLRLVQRLNLEQIVNPVDARQRLLNRVDLDRLRPFAATKKAAA